MSLAESKLSDVAAGHPVPADAVAGSVAAVLVAWLKARASRKVILTLRDKRIVHIEGYSVEQVKELLPSVDHGTAFDQAGKGTANEESLIHAIEYAVKLAL